MEIEINGGDTVYAGERIRAGHQTGMGSSGDAARRNMPEATASPGATPAVGNSAQLGDSFWVAAQIPVVEAVRSTASRP